MISKKYVIVLCFLFFSVCGTAQFTDDFSDGEFLTNPTWSGDVAKFDASSGELQLNAPAVTDVAYLSVSSQAINNAQWDFKVRLNFNPSGSNYARIYLVSNNNNLGVALNGYYIQFGSADDDICLYRQTGTTRTKIIDGPNGLLNTSVADATVRVTRDGAGNWEVLADTLSGTNYVSQGTTNDATHLQSLFSGVFCTYTATRSDDFFFDDFVVTGTPFSDPTPPVVSLITVVGNNGLHVLFNEPIQPASAQNILHYNLSNGFGNPVSATVDGGNNAQVNLVFTGSFSLQAFYTLAITGVQDFSGNTMADTSLLISLYQAQPFDLVMNELMPAPDAPITISDLPNEEYVELYNRTAFPIDLTGWKLEVNGSLKTIVPAIILPDSFLIITDNALSSPFPAGIAITSITTSSLGLVNAGAALRLLDQSGQEIDAVTYNNSYYNNSLLDDGGYAMERVNPDEPCAGSVNWKASLDVSGGTPGRKNFWYNTNPISFVLTLEEVVSSNIVDLHFSKRPDSTSLDISDLMVDQGIGMPDSIVKQTPEVFRAYFSNGLAANTIYNLMVMDTIKDCQGNAISLSTQLELVYFQPNVFDLVINEIMADPTPPVLLAPEEYIEIYNRTLLPVNVKNWVIQVGNTNYTLPNASIPPDSFLLVGNLNVKFSNPNTNVVGLLTNVSIPNDGASISLISPQGMVVHNLAFTTAWYKNTSKKDGGWSLEQMDPNLPCLGEDNWKASVDSTGGTPGRKNSVFQVLSDTSKPVMLRAGYGAPDTLLIYFTESLQPNTFQPVDFMIDQGMGNPLSVEVLAPNYRTVRLILPSLPVVGVEYRVSMTGNAADCAGNIADTITVRWSIPETALPGDILINEVLFDPIGAGEDYVEIYNHSDKAIDLKELRLATADTLTNNIESVRVISTTSALIMPGQYVLLSKSMKQILSVYHTEDERAFWNVPEIPTYSNSYGVVVVTNVSLHFIDRFFYKASMHYPLLNSVDGVALERLSWNKPTQDKSNWHSAAQTVGFGTPGYLNSQFIPFNTGGDNFTIDPDIFSPDLDGYQDNLVIRYQFDVPGYAATITIVDNTGRVVKTLLNNELLATQGEFYWDGIMDGGGKARVGVFAACFEVFNPEGNKAAFKKAFTVAARF